MADHRLGHDRCIRHLSQADIAAIDIVGPQPKKCSKHDEPAAIVLKIKDANVSCRFLGRGISRYVWEISKKYVFKYDHYQAEIRARRSVVNDKELEFARLHPDFHANMFQTAKGSLIAESAAYTVGHLMRDLTAGLADSADGRVLELACEFLNWLAKLIVYSSRNWFRLNDLNLGNIGYSPERRSWVLIDSGSCRTAGGPLTGDSQWRNVDKALLCRTELSGAAFKFAALMRRCIPGMLHEGAREVNLTVLVEALTSSVPPSVSRPTTTTGDADTGFAMSSSSAHVTAALRRPSASLLEVVVVGDSTWCHLMQQQDLVVQDPLRPRVRKHCLIKCAPGGSLIKQGICPCAPSLAQLRHVVEYEPHDRE